MENSSPRKVRLILVNLIRFVLILTFFIALFENRRLILFTSVIALIATFIPTLMQIIFHVKWKSSFDIIVILFVYGLLFYWEIEGVYSNLQIMALIMNFASAIVLGILGLTAVYTFSRYENLKASPLMVSFFSFCFAFTAGTLLELAKLLTDTFFGFHIREVGIFGTMGNLLVNMSGSLLVSAIGYLQIRKGKSVLISTFLEDFAERNPKLFGVKQNNEDYKAHVTRLIKEGEGKNVEFKSTLRTNLHTKKIDKAMEHSVLKTINAYLNSTGGTLLVGVSDKGELLGLENDEFQNEDAMHRYLSQIVNYHIGAEFLPLIKTHVVEIDGKKVLKIEQNTDNL